MSAYINRGTLECTIALKELEKDTLADAFAYLIDHLEHTATERFLQMTWPPGETILNFIARYMAGGKAPQLRPKQMSFFD